MRNFIIILSFLFSSVLNSNAQCPENLVLHLPLDGNAFDFSLNFNNGLVNGAQLTHDRFGIINNAYYFDGVDDEISISDNSSLDLTEEWTISVWVKPDSGYGSFLNEHVSIIDKWGEGGVNNAAYTLGVYTGGFMEGLTYSGNSGTYGHTNGVIPTNEWTHLVLTRHIDSTLSYYINGVLDKEILGSQIPQNSNFPLKIGMAASPTVNSNSPNEYRFKGSIDEIKIFTCSLTDEEVYSIDIPEVLEYENIFQIIENPVQNTLYLSNHSLNNYTLIISDVLGKTIIKSNYSANGIDVSELKYGLYSITFFTEDGEFIESKKMVKQ